MKKTLLLCLLFSTCLICSAKQTIRQKLTFDQGWQFRLCKDTEDVLYTLRMCDINDNPLSDEKKVTAKTKVTDDTEPEQAQVTASEITSGKGSAVNADAVGVLRNVQIPHDWSSELPFEPEMGGSAGYLAGGQGVYVKDFTLPSSAQKGEKYTVAFDGVYHRATVWLNGHRLGYHMYGYTGFEFDLTPYLNVKGKNRIVVHVNREEQSRWYTGSGIYRHVWLKVTSASHLKTDGIFVRTTDDGTVRIDAAIDTAATNMGKTFKVRNTILDANGKEVKGKVSRRWSVDNPYLYTAVTQLYDSRGKLLDEVRTQFGYRTFNFDADKGFSLNNQPMKLKGMCLHQDAGSLGVAVPEEVWLRRLKALKDIGCNAIRCSHNPPSPEFLDICDSIGLLVIDEAFDKWKSGYYVIVKK